MKIVTTPGKKISITIDGKKVMAEDNRPILFCARALNIDIPTLCHDNRLTPYTSCFLCVIEIENIKDLVPSCTRCPEEGMVITTNNKRIYEARKAALELLVSDHFANCIAPSQVKFPPKHNEADSAEEEKPKKIKKWLSRRSDFKSTEEKPTLCVKEIKPGEFENREINLYHPKSSDCKICLCKKLSDCELRILAVKYGLNQIDHLGKYHSYELRQLVSSLTLDMNKCIRCAKCIRVCDEIQHAGLLEFIYRGFDTEIYYHAHSKKKEELCRQCRASGAKCVAICPTGGLGIRD